MIFRNPKVRLFAGQAACVALASSLLISCETLRTKEPGGTVLTHTAVGAGAGALVGWAAGDAGAGAAIGAGVGLLAGAVEASEQSREQEQPKVVEYRTVTRTEYVIPSEVEANRRQAYDYISAAHRARDPQDAEFFLKRSLELHPTPEAHNALGTVYSERGDVNAAEVEWRRALRIDPNFRPARSNLEKIGRA